MRQSDYPLPSAVGELLMAYDDDDLRNYAKEIVGHCGHDGRMVDENLRWKAVEALDTLSYFHGLSCKGGGNEPCLGGEIEAVIIRFTT